MPDMRVCKECGKMFVPKGREKYCPDTHYRPCPVCGTLVVAKYLSDPPCKCDNCKRKKMQPASKAKSLFDISSSTINPIKPMNSEIAKINPVTTGSNKVEIKETTDENLQDEPAKKVKIAGAIQIDTSKIVEPEVFCETYDDKIMKYIGPTVEGFNKFKNNHDYKIALTRKDNYYMITSCHDLTERCETNCFYIASSQLSVSTRFVVVDG